MSVKKLTPGPACDGKKIFIEVTGLEHGPEHTVQFYDESNMVQQESLEKKRTTEALENTSVYSWDREKQNTPLHAWLAITSDSGQIKLPLFKNIQVKDRVDSEQDYLLHAIMPLTVLPTYNTSLSDRDKLAPVRNGYIYIFYNHKAWREIEIRTQDNGSVNLKDVDLCQYRQGTDKPFLNEKRIAVGSPLKEIWVPAKDNNSGANVHLAYSEVQWSSARLNALEKDPKQLTSRLIAFHLINIDGKTDLLRAENLPEMRARSPEVEQNIADPIALNRELSGQYISTLYKKIESEQEQLQQGGNSALQVFKQHNDQRFEYGVREHALRVLTQQKKEDFAQLTSTPDYLSDAKIRKLRVLTLTDPIFLLRHHTSLTLLASGYLQQVQLSAAENKHFHCAELVQRIVIPEALGGKENQLHKFKDDIYNNLGGTFHRTIRTIERQLFRTDFNLLQQSLASVLNEPDLAIALLDLTSMSGVNGAAGHVVIGSAFSALSLDGDKLDTLLPLEERENPASLQTLVNILDPKAGHPLHPLLFVSPNQITLNGEYIPPEADNDGSGLATPSNIARWANENLLADEAQLESADLVAIMASANNNAGSFTNYRRISGVVDGILKGFFTALFTIKSVIDSGAMSLDFNALYISSLSTLKAINSQSLASMTYVPVTGVPLKGYVVGVHGAGLVYGVTETQKQYKYGTRGSKIAYGSFHDEAGNLVASTKKSHFAKGTPLIRTDMRMVMIDENSDLAMNKVEAQRALNNSSKSTKNVSHLYETLRVPYIISVIEMINLINTINGLKSEKNRIKQGFNIISAGIDLGVALVHASNMMSHNASTLAKASQNTFVFSLETVARFTTPGGKFRLISMVSRLEMVRFAGGMLTAAIAAWDASRLYSAQDKDAAMAMSMVALGTGISSIASTFISASTTLLGLGPIAWLGIAIAIGAGVLYYYFKDSPMETWLKNGPFGESPATSGDYELLQDPQVALSQFINLIMSLSVTVYPIEQIKIDANALVMLKGKDVTHAVMLRSNLLQLINDDRVNVRVFARQSIAKTTEKIRRTGRSKSTDIITPDHSNTPIIDSLTTAEGRLFFMAFNKPVPKNSFSNSWFKTQPNIYTYQPHFMVRAQIEIDDQAFPTLPINELAASDNPKALPVFSEHDKYWADELNYGLY
ncbi:MAG: hypothetical protein JKY55_18745 [Aliivibrio sp.]|uniref:toxin VasX n=1 Tax=Aliivibrio sp. TaxID=1872443 RepID=UPI001A43043D|nr:hypothetical protein [Aliivibrio sp.]